MNQFPEPIAGRIGHVGGIESLVLDGQTYFFGFDYSSDLVLSPLIDSVDAMAQFASRYMEQRDGAHDAGYWRELVEMSANDSGLCSDLESRTFSSAMIANTVTYIAQAALNNSVDSIFSIQYHLLYLLGAAGGWEGPSFDKIEELVYQISGQEALQDGQTISAIAGDLQDALNVLVGATPGNWTMLFAGLQSR